MPPFIIHLDLDMLDVSEIWGDALAGASLGCDIDSVCGLWLSPVDWDSGSLGRIARPLHCKL